MPRQQKGLSTLSVFNQMQPKRKTRLSLEEYGTIIGTIVSQIHINEGKVILTDPSHPDKSVEAQLLDSAISTLFFGADYRNHRIGDVILKASDTGAIVRLQRKGFEIVDTLEGHYGGQGDGVILRGGTRPRQYFDFSPQR